MSLGHLLTVGHSLTKGVFQPSPYRMHGGSRLPDFSKGLKPHFSQTTRSCAVFQPELFSPAPERKSRASSANPTLAAAATAVPSLTAAAEGRGGQGAAPLGEASRGRDARGVFTDGLVRSEEPERDEPGLLKRWLARENMRLERKTAGQTELSLKEVRVVRNDLSESDLEFVSSAVVAEVAVAQGGQMEFVKPAAQETGEALVTSATPPAEGGGGGWTRFVGRFFLLRQARSSAR